jgi:uroporphyrinogen-III synthase
MRVLITRPERGLSRTLEALAAAGYRAEPCPVTAVRLLDAPHFPADLIEQAGLLVLTSPNSVELLVQLGSRDPGVRLLLDRVARAPHRHPLPVAALGQATATAVYGLLETPARYVPADEASQVALARHLLAQPEIADLGPVLFPCAEGSALHLKQSLEERGIAVHMIPFYKSDVNEAGIDRLIQQICTLHPSQRGVVTFHAPSQVRAVFQHPVAGPVVRHSVAGAACTAVFAGPTTYEASLPWAAELDEGSLVMMKPSDATLMEVLARLKSDAE